MCGGQRGRGGVESENDMVDQLQRRYVVARLFCAQCHNIDHSQQLSPAISCLDRVKIEEQLDDVRP